MNDELLKAALMGALEEDLRDAWNDTEPVEFSPAYLAWEADFLKGAAHIRRRRPPRRWARVLLAAAIAAALLIVGAVAVSQNWIMVARTADRDHPAWPGTNMEDYVNGEQELILELGDRNYEETESEFPLYEPAWLPDGMAAVNNTPYIYKGHVLVEYRGQALDSRGFPHQSEEVVYFSYARYTNLRVLMEDVSYQETSVNGNPGWLVYYVSNGEVQTDNISLMWYDTQKEMAFSLIYSHYGKDVEDDLFRMAESVSRIS